MVPGPDVSQNYYDYETVKLEAGDTYSDKTSDNERRMSCTIWTIANCVIGVSAMMYGIVWYVLSGFLADSGTRLATNMAYCSILISTFIVLGGLLHAVGCHVGTSILKGSILIHIIYFAVLWGVLPMLKMERY
jgi:hypothetical protein